MPPNGSGTGSTSASTARGGSSSRSPTLSENSRREPLAAGASARGDVYIQHNPHVGDGKEAFIDYFERMAREWLGRHGEFKRAIAEVSYVVLHCYQQWPGDQNYAGIDIFRLDDAGKFIEHWDVLQVVPSESKNDNGMF